MMIHNSAKAKMNFSYQLTTLSIYLYPLELKKQQIELVVLHSKKSNHQINLY